ncbi:pitrilysin family protein [Oscillatoria sp. CS-180]|uniref:M16 family metallopeptidase n=1 Tax=Oscillatoria sp. CS-180 TaxID=3021720 RepID=UPI0023300CCC|nr:pitrilysin family protein [Oscillatoria sp. CS-180]MDB9529197.1 pitrilysin family protein [Oscillatoria sp. CS-180]
MTSAIAVNSPQQSLTAPTVRRLSNGLTIIAEQIPVEAVNLSLWFRVGSAIESGTINGMAHFLEHMIFKGTSRLPVGEFERRIEAHGGITNAATSQDYTQFFITSAPQDFASLAPLQIELVMNPLLTDEEFERERSVILEEISRANDNPRRRTFYRSMEVAFERLPYRRPVLGPESVIERLTAQQMREFHAYWYQPERITAVAVGNLPVETLIQTVADGFDQALAFRSANPITRYSDANIYRSAPESPFTTVQRHDHVDPAFQQARLVLNWRVPGLADFEKTSVLDVLSSVLGRGRMSRLVQDLRQEQQLVTSISASNLAYWQQGVFSIAAQLPEENLEAVEAAITNHIAEIRERSITATELQRIQTQVANRYIFGSESPSDRAGLYGYYQTLTGQLNHALSYPEKVQRLTPADIQAAAQEYLSADAYGVVTIRPGS